jgi:macrodomain Ter protein organizer (MatP/YcbG family)
MSKQQWGHGFHSGQQQAKKSAKQAIQELRAKELRPFELINAMMNEHPNKELVNQLHSAILQSSLSENYHKAAWLMMDTGEIS